MTTYFTSDNHFFHRKIIEYCDRPFSTIEEMNFELIKRYNSLVNKNDTVYFLGDFAFTKNVNDIINVLQQLNGNKHFICGNHDKIMLHDIIKKQFVTFTESNIKEILVDDVYITLCHYPMLTWHNAMRGTWQLFGHIHSGILSNATEKDLSLKPSQYDVGVDAWNYYPVSFEDIRDKLSKLPERTIKHH